MLPTWFRLLLVPFAASLAIAAGPSVKPAPRTDWAGLLESTKWQPWKDVPPEQRSPGVYSVRQGQEPISVFGRLVLRQRDRGELATGERYVTLVAFVPAGMSFWSPDLIPLAEAADAWTKTLLEAGDFAVVLRGTPRQVKTQSTGGPAAGVGTTFEDLTYERLSGARLDEVARDLLPDAPRRQALLRRLKPVVLPRIKVFLDAPVINTELHGGPTLFMSYRVFNPSSVAAQFEAPTVDLIKDKKTLVARASVDCSRRVGSKGFAMYDAGARELCTYALQPGVKAGDEVVVRVRFTDGTKTTVYRETVTAR